MSNMALPGLESEGLLLSPSGVFLVKCGNPYSEQDFDARYHWTAVTWIADSMLADNTGRRRAIADAVSAARQRGNDVGFVTLRLT